MLQLAVPKISEQHLASLASSYTLFFVQFLYEMFAWVLNFLLNRSAMVALALPPASGRMPPPWYCT